MTSDSPRQKDRAELAVEQGFEGTFRDFVAWLEPSIVNGSMQVEPFEDEWGRTRTRVSVEPGGYSTAERLLGRLKRSMWMRIHWVKSEYSTDVYEFRQDIVDSDEVRVWLRPDDGVLEVAYRARTVRVVDEHGDTFEIAVTHGAKIAFHESDHDILDPTGVIEITPAVPFEDDPY